VKLEGSRLRELLPRPVVEPPARKRAYRYHAAAAAYRPSPDEYEYRQVNACGVWRRKLVEREVPAVEEVQKDKMP